MTGFETVVQPAKFIPWLSGARGWSRVPIKRGLLLVLSVLGLAGLFWSSLYLAAGRIYQVDECTNVLAAHALALGQARDGSELFQMLLSLVVGGLNSSVDLLACCRQVMVVIFWLNWLLIAAAAGERVLSSRWWGVLLGGATLAPLWDYGFEIRHDNLMLAGLLLAWSLIRFGPPKTWSYFLVGMIACVLQFTAIKAIVYTAPLSLAILVFPPPGGTARRWKLALAWLLGVAAMWIAVRLTLGAAGVWDEYMCGAKGIAGASVGAGRHRYWWPTLALTRLVQETPLITAFAIAALAAWAVDLRRNWRNLFDWAGLTPEIFLVAVAFMALLINPTPFLYNLVSLVPFVFLLAYRYGTRLCRDLGQQPGLLPLLASLLVFAHFFPFLLATRRHYDRPNLRQERLMHLAEALTDPAKDPVFDAIGMVPTRPFIDDRAFVHTTSYHRSLPQVPIREMLEKRPAAVIIPNYRTDWLAAGVHELIRKRYVCLADDFWVLGSVLPAGGGTFEVVHPGRYRIAPLEDSDLAGTHSDGFSALLKKTHAPSFTGILDGGAVKVEAIALTAGIHEIKCEANVQPAIVWVGPELNRLPRMLKGDHTQLFVNGY